ncbi:hypothetical protein CRYUN_Cryun37aG0014400 [Craigia yunnanensis]
MLIPGEHSPGMSNDVFLQPLIEELKELWEVGVETFDAHAKQNFRLHAAILWTISDFPAYGDLSGWLVKGYKACPSCHKHSKSVFKGLKKNVLLGKTSLTHHLRVVFLMLPKDSNYILKGAPEVKGNINRR